MSSVSRDRSARRTTLGPSDSAASTRARLVRDLLPGSETTASTGPAAVGAGQGSGGRRLRSSCALASCGLPSRGRGEAPGLAAGVLGGAAGRQATPGLAVGVAGGDEQAAEHARRS